MVVILGESSMKLIGVSCTVDFRMLAICLMVAGGCIYHTCFKQAVQHGVPCAVELNCNFTSLTYQEQQQLWRPSRAGPEKHGLDRPRKWPLECNVFEVGPRRSVSKVSISQTILKQNSTLNTMVATTWFHLAANQGQFWRQ